MLGKCFADKLVSETAAQPENNFCEPEKNKTSTKFSRKRKRCPERVSDKADKEEEFSVEFILNHEEHNGRVTQYLVKWEGWGEDDSTWEPFENLEGCLETIVSYFETKLYGFAIPHYSESRYLTLKNELSKCSDLELEDLCRQYFLNSGDVIPTVDEKKLDENLNLLARLPPCARDYKFLKKVRHLLLCNKLKSLRRFQISSLNKWQDEINLASAKGSAKIEVYNCVDLEGPPSDFIYVDDYIPGYRVNIPEGALLGCDCSKRCYFKCSNFHGSEKAYNSHGLLRIERGTPIFECNKMCKCSMDCENRVVQKGRRYSLCIFRTHNGRGWGVKSMEAIPKGAFVTRYAGEIITSEEAERRGRYYDKEGITYLFDLDFNDPVNFPYTVDAKVYGNVSHFINHSCSPNLEVFAVWIDCMDPNVPLLCLFASKNIKEGEELTFDYLCQPLDENHKFRGTGVSAKNGLSQKVICKCGSDNCRKFLF